MNKSTNQRHPDLDALLNTVPADEANRLQEVWDLLGNEEPTGLPNAQTLSTDRQRFNAIMDAASGAALPPIAHPGRYRDRRPRAVQRHRLVWRSTAALATLLVAGLLGMLWWQSPITKTARPGERLAVMLPDGSQAELNSGSSLHYNRHFGAVRAVRLEGEAFFDVVPGERPFVVQTFNAEVRVLGTRFGVRAWFGGLEEATTVALETGRVTLTPAGQPERTVTLAPGEIRRVQGQKDAVDVPLVSTLSVDDATAWRQGDLISKDQPLGVVLGDVERRFGVHLQVQAPSLRQRRVNLALRQPTDAEAVVRDLATALGIRYRAISNGYELYADAP